jgi:CRP-like cAMP-binding protein
MMLDIEKLIILKSIELFSHIPEKELIWLAAQIDIVEYGPDMEIIHQGEIGTSMYVIVDGEVDVIVNDNSVAKLSTKDFFGELAALDPEPRSATIKTITDSLLFKIEREIIYDLVNQYQSIAQGIIKVLCKRIRESS